jgi:hypothetical protein
MPISLKLWIENDQDVPSRAPYSVFSGGIAVKRELEAGSMKFLLEAVCWSVRQTHLADVTILAHNKGPLYVTILVHSG